MGRKSIATKLLDSSAALSAVYTSPATNVQQTDIIGYTVETSSVTANTGVFSLQGQIVDSFGNASAWIDMTLSPVPTLANANATFAITATFFPYTNVRLKFTPGGGGPNGTAKIFINVKAVGG